MLDSSGLRERLEGQGTLIGSRLSTQTAPPDVLPGPAELVLEHDRIPFVSYPYEWPFSMLKDAALLQLELELDALEHGMTMRDATPYNVQWLGAAPVFIDVGSFERIREGEAWAGYRQFCMQFLYPLMLRSVRGVSHRPWLRGSIDGISPSEMSSLLSVRDRFRRGVFKHIYLHARLERRYAGAGGELRRELGSAGFSSELVEANVRGLTKLVRRLDWTPEASAWSGYGEANRYSERDAAAKAEFIERAAREIRPGLLWDLGANEGTYTRIAAEHSDYAVAWDGDEATIDRLYCGLREAAEGKILPLVADLADPSPGLGWRGRERADALTRGKPDMLLALALVHHLTIGSKIPLVEVLDWLRAHDAPAVVEFVEREDPMAELLLSRKEEGAHPDYTRATFEAELSARFALERSADLCDGQRTLYLVKPA